MKVGNKNDKTFVFAISSEETNEAHGKFPNYVRETVNPNNFLYCICLLLDDYIDAVIVLNLFKDRLKFCF
jgi:hypothetical protein